MVRMITASKTLKKHISLQRRKEVLAKKWNISRQALHQIQLGHGISTETIARILDDTGYEFETAFIS